VLSVPVEVESRLDEAKSSLVRLLLELLTLVFFLSKRSIALVKL
jgi:hypothetical protein